MNRPNLQPATAPVMNWQHWRLVLLLVGVCFLGHFNRTSMATAGDLQIMQQYGLAPAKMGLVYSAFLLTYTLFMVPGGWLIDRRGPKFSLIIVCLGSAAFIVLTAAVGLAATAVVAFPAFLVVRGAMGMLNAPLHPASANAVSLGIPFARRSTVNGLVTGAALLGVASSYVVFGKLVDWFRWPVAFLFTAAVTAALGWAWLRYAGLHRTESGETRGPAAQAPDRTDGVRHRWWLARHKNLILLTISYASIGYFQYLFFYWAHYYFSEELKLGEEASRFYAGIPPLAMAVGMPLGGWLSDRIHEWFGWRVARAGLVFVAMSVSAVLLWVGVRADEPLVVVAWLSAALGVLGMAEGPFWATAVEIGGRRGGLSAGIFNTGGNIGGMIAPVATPVVSAMAGGGWQTAISVASVVCLVGACCWIWIDDGRSEPQRADRLAPAPQPSAVPPTVS